MTPSDAQIAKLLGISTDLLSRPNYDGLRDPVTKQYSTERYSTWLREKADVVEAALERQAREHQLSHA